jgi:MORN repeat
MLAGAVAAQAQIQV